MMDEPQVKSDVTLADIRKMSQEEHRQQYPKGFVEDYTTLQLLAQGARLDSANAKYFLAHSSRDGWLCLYNAGTGEVVWCNGHNGAWTSSPTASSPAATCMAESPGRHPSRGDVTSELIVNGKGYLMIGRINDHKVLWTSPH